MLSRVAILVALSSCGALAAPRALLAAVAAALPVGAEIQVNVGAAAAAQLNPQVAVFSDGGFTVVWTVQAVAGGRSVLHARSFAASGEPVSGEFLLVSQPGSQKVDAVAADGNVLVAVWEHISHGVSGLFVGRFERGGTPLGGPVEVTAPSPYDRYGGRLGVGPHGGFVVAWTADATYPSAQFYHSDVYLRRFSVAGAPRGEATLVFEGEIGDGGESSAGGLGVAADGVITAAVEDLGDDESVLIFFVGADGSVTQGPSPDSEDNEDLSAALAMASDGSFVTAWSSGGFTSSAVHGRSFDAGADPAEGAAFLINRDGSANDSFAYTPLLAAMPGGAFVAVWSESHSDGPSGYGVFARAFAAGGVAVTRDSQLSLASAGNQFATSLAGNAAGDLVAVWQSTTGPAFVVARRLNGSSL
jgi:hypothetical protein